MKRMPIPVAAATVTIMAAMMIVSGGCGNEAVSGFTGSGVIEATEIVVSAETNGRLDRVRIDEGGMVAAGDTIADIDVEALVLERAATAADIDQINWNARVIAAEVETIRESVRQAEIARDNASSTFDRIKGLYADNAVTRDRYDGSETEYKLAVSRVESAQRNLDTAATRGQALEANRVKLAAALDLLDYRITKGHVISPSDGTVLVKYAESGEFTAPGKPVCSIADLSAVKLTIYVGETLLGKIALGGDVQIGIDSYPDRRFSGTITRIAEKAEFTPKNVQTRDSRIDLVYAVEITIDNPEGIFKIGMPADAYIEGI